MADGKVEAGGFVRESEAIETAETFKGIAPRLTQHQESKLIHYCDQKLLDISRLYKNRALQDSELATASAALDLILDQVSGLFDVLCKVPLASSSIAISYMLLILGSHLIDYLGTFDPSPETTFALIGRMDNYLAFMLTKDKLNMTERTRLTAIITRIRDTIYDKYPGEQYEAACSRAFQGTVELM